MKSSEDPRHIKRQHIVEDLFRTDFYEGQEVDEETKKILNQKETLDSYITKAAPQFPIDKINKVDLAILRLAVYELMQKTAPEKVVIDEAIELAKEFGGETSPAFVNGALGNIKV